MALLITAVIAVLVVSTLAASVNMSLTSPMSSTAVASSSPSIDSSEESNATEPSETTTAEPSSLEQEEVDNNDSPEEQRTEEQIEPERHEDQTQNEQEQQPTTETTSPSSSSSSTSSSGLSSTPSSSAAPASRGNGAPENSGNNPHGGPPQGKPCTISKNCPYGDVCVDSVCQRVKCTTNSECASYGGVCEPIFGLCTPIECNNDQDCDNPNQVCQNQICVPENQQQCKADSNCRGQQFKFCVNEECVQCRTDSDCPNPKQPICIDNVCERGPECTTDQDCIDRDPTYPICDTRTGHCKLDDHNTNQCNSDANCVDKDAYCDTDADPNICACKDSSEVFDRVSMQCKRETCGPNQCGTYPQCQTQDDQHCGPMCQPCADNQACQDGLCFNACDPGTILCRTGAFPPETCADPSTGATRDANGNCACPEGLEMNADTGRCECPQGETFCSSHNQCIDLSSPLSCGSSCDDIKQCAAPSGGTVTCDSGQCIQECPPLGDIEYEPVDGVCVPKCPSGASRIQGICQCDDPEQHIGTISGLPACVPDCSGGQTNNPDTGECELVCSPGLNKCGTGSSEVCSNLQIDDENCGTCGNVCPSGTRCISGQCTQDICPTAVRNDPNRVSCGISDCCLPGGSFPGRVTCYVPSDPGSICNPARQECDPTSNQMTSPKFC